MSRYRHGNPLWYSCPHKVPDCRPSKVVRDLTGKTSLFASPLPRAPQVFNALAVSMEDIETLGITDQMFLPLLSQDSPEFLGQVDETAIFVFRGSSVQPDRSFL